MTFDRDSLIADYVQQTIDAMDMKTMEEVLYYFLSDNLSAISDEELITEVEENYPELLNS